MTEFLNAFNPTAMQVKLGVVGSALGTFFTYVFGWNDIIVCLLLLMVLDYISGILAAIINEALALNSSKGYKGIFKKLGILIGVAVAHIIGQTLHVPALYDVVLWFYACNEGLSVLENLAKCGVPFPAKLKDTLEQLKDTKGGK